MEIIQIRKRKIFDIVLESINTSSIRSGNDITDTILWLQKNGYAIKGYEIIFDHDHAYMPPPVHADTLEGLQKELSRNAIKDIDEVNFAATINGLRVRGSIIPKASLIQIQRPFFRGEILPEEPAPEGKSEDHKESETKTINDRKVLGGENAINKTKTAQKQAVPNTSNSVRKKKIKKISWFEKKKQKQQKLSEPAAQSSASGKPDKFYKFENGTIFKYSPSTLNFYVLNEDDEWMLDNSISRRYFDAASDYYEINDPLKGTHNNT